MKELTRTGLLVLFSTVALVVCIAAGFFIGLYAVTWTLSLF